MRFLILLAGFGFFFSCVKNTSSSPEIYKIIIKGTVVDQVTREPAEGATVFVGSQWAGFMDDSVYAPRSMITGPDGKYEIETEAAPLSLRNTFPKSWRNQLIAIIAKKNGYMGSNRTDLSYYDGRNSTLETGSTKLKSQTMISTLLSLFLAISSFQRLTA